MFEVGSPKLRGPASASSFLSSTVAEILCASLDLMFARQTRRLHNKGSEPLCRQRSAELRELTARYSEQ